MRTRSLGFAIVAPLLALAACGTDTGTGLGVGHSGGSNSTATVQLVNATGGALDVATNGVVGAGDANVGFGGASSCITVNPTAPGLTVRQAGTTSTFGNFTPTFAAGGRYTVVAYLNSAGTTQFAELPGAFTPTSGQAGLRVFNGAPNTGSFDAYVTAPGASLVAPSAASVAFGTASNFFNVPSGGEQLRFTNAGTSTIALDAGTNAFVSGQTSTAVLAPTVFGGALGSFILPGC